MTTFIFFAILAFFTWRGYQKGFVGAITKVLSILIAYPAAIFFTKPFANILRAYTSFDGLFLFLIAGCTIFFATSLLVTLVLNGLAKLVPSNQFTATGSKIGGTLFGIVFGSVIGLVAVYMVGILAKPESSSNVQIANQSPLQQSENENDNPTNTKQPSAAEAESIQKYVIDGGAPFRDSKDSIIDSTAKKLVSTAASNAVGIITDDKTSSQFTKTLTQDPQAMLDHVQNMTNNGEIKELLNKPEFQAELNHGNAQSLLKNKDFQELMQNPDMKAIIASSDDAATNQLSEQATAEKMIQAWQKVTTLKNDPRVLNIVNDPAFQAQLNSPNKLPLLMNPQMRELSEIIFSSDAAPSVIQSAEPTASNNETKQVNSRYVVEDITNGVKYDGDTSNADKSTDEPQEKKLYKWTDADGKVHFSDSPIKK